MKIRIFKLITLLFIVLLSINAYANTYDFNFVKNNVELSNITSNITQNENFVNLELNGTMKIEGLKAFKVDNIFSINNSDINISGFASYYLSSNEILNSIRLYSNYSDKGHLKSLLTIDGNDLAFVKGDYSKQLDKYIFTRATYSNINYGTNLNGTTFTNVNINFPFELNNNGLGLSETSLIFKNMTYNKTVDGFIKNAICNFTLKIKVNKNYVSYYNNLYILVNPIDKVYFCSNKIDISSYLVCNHNFIVDYTTINKNGHTEYCNKCKWNKIVSHKYTNTYDGIANNQCACGYNEYANISIYDTDNNKLYGNKLNTFSSIDVNLSSLFDSSKYEIDYIDEYEYAPKDYDYSNNEYNLEYISRVSRLPDNINNLSLKFKVYTKEKITYNSTQTNNNGSSGSSGGSGRNRGGSIPINDKLFGNVDEEKLLGSSPTYDEVDLSVFDPPVAPAHTHFFSQTYNKTQHYEYCTVCGYKRNVKNHNYTEVWTCFHDKTKESSIYGDSGNKGYRCYPLNGVKLICLECGYSINGTKDSCVNKEGSFRCVPDKFSHYYSCDKCGYSIINGESCYYTLNGKKVNILCGTGTCEVCGYTYTHSNHSLYIAKGNVNTDNEPYRCLCRYCKKEFCNITNYSKTQNNQTLKVSFNVNITDPNLVIYNAWNLENDAGFYQSYTKYFENISNTTKKMSYEIILNNAIYINMSNILDLNSVNRNDIMVYLESGVSFPIQIDEGKLVDDTIRFDLIPPQNINIDINDQEIKNVGGVKWVNQKNFIISGTENMSNIVSLTIKDNDNKQYYQGTTSVKDNKFSFSITPEIEAGSIKTFTFTFTDVAGNYANKTIQINNTDALSPKITSSYDYTKDWSKEKIITINANENGIGLVQIALNNANDFKMATLNNNVYSRTYKIVGDIYTEVNPIVYVKDGLEHLTYQELKVNKIDNTIPTITKIEQNKNDFGNTNVVITGHDNHSSKGAGSGISYFAVVKHGTKVNNSDFNIPAVKNNNQYTGTTNLLYFGEYDFYAKDLVGNISLLKTSPIDVDIKYNINCEYMCENEHKSILLKDVVIGTKTNLPELKILPITEDVIGWKYNDLIVNSSIDLDKYVKNNNETITIMFANANAYTYDDFDSIKYNINCEYICENENKSILLKDVVIGTKTDLPELKILPITEDVIGWKYNNLIVNSSIDLDKYVKNNDETITIKFANANAYTYDDFDNIKYNINCEYKCENENKSILLKDVVIGTKTNLPELKVLPITEDIIGWKYNDIIVNSSIDLDKYVKNNDETITIKFANANAYTYDDFDNIKYNINCEYKCENENKSILLKDVVIGTKTNLPELKVLPITEDIIGWKYNDIIVNSSIDLDKYVKNNGETITIKFANTNAYTYDDFDNINYNVLYIHTYVAFNKNKFEETITYKIGQNEDLLELKNFKRFKNKGWYYDEDKVNNTSDLEKYISNNGQTIVLNFIIHYEKGELRTYSNGGYGGAERTDRKRIIEETGLSPISEELINDDFAYSNNINNYKNKTLYEYIKEVYDDFTNNDNKNIANSKNLGESILDIYNEYKSSNIKDITIKIYENVSKIFNDFISSLNPNKE